MSDIAPARRFALAFVGIAASAALLRGPISDALVARGDALLYRARPSDALRMYRRALRVDARNAVAADRFAFVALTTDSRAAVREGVRWTSAILTHDPKNATLRMDRALAYRRLGAQSQALADFARVGAATGDPRALAFAGYAALRVGDRRQARRLWRASLRRSPGFIPALDGLRRLR